MAISRENISPIVTKEMVAEYHEQNPDLNYCIIPNEAKEIEAAAFEGCDWLEYVEIPESVKTIGSMAFKNSGIVELPSLDNVTFLRSHAFFGCTSLNSANLPSCIRIPQAAFAKCSNLSMVSIAENTETIEINAFNGCTNLQAISFPDSLKLIEANAFSNCPNLTDVTLPNNCKYDTSAFASTTQVHGGIPTNTISEDTEAAFAAFSVRTPRPAFPAPRHNDSIRDSSRLL